MNMEFGGRIPGIPGAVDVPETPHSPATPEVLQGGASPEGSTLGLGRLYSSGNLGQPDIFSRPDRRPTVERNRPTLKPTTGAEAAIDTPKNGESWNNVPGERSFGISEDAKPKGVEATTRPTDLAAQERELDSVLGRLHDGTHSLRIVHGNAPDTNAVQIKDGTISYIDKTVEVASLDADLEAKRSTFLGINERVIAAAKEISDTDAVFAPFNGGETIGLLSDYTLATDRLPIGTPNQVKALADNEFAKGLYLVDKLGRGHSYSGVTHALGYTGAMLQWDIKHIQGGVIQEIAYLDTNGSAIIDPDASAAGIRLTYTTSDNQTRIHEQYSCDSRTLPAPVRTRLAAGTFDGLYLRGTESLVTSQKFFREYRSYVRAVRPGGLVVADTTRNDMTWNMGGQFSSRHTTVEMAPGEQFGYAAVDAKVSRIGVAALAGYITILQKARSQE